MLFLKLHKNKPPCTVAIAGQCAAAQINLFAELTGSFICEFPRFGLIKGMYYYKYREYFVSCISPGSPAEEAEDFDCVIYVMNPYRLESELVNALRYSRKARRLVLFLCAPRGGAKATVPVNIKLLSGALRARAVFETRFGSRGVNRLLDAVESTLKQEI